MGKRAKSSRKGKKAWRANISTEDIDDFYENSTKDALTGGSVADHANDSLFFVDKSRDLSVKRKIEKHRDKVLRYESALQKNPFVQAVPSSIRKKSKTEREAGSKFKENTQEGVENFPVMDSSMVDLWEGENEGKGKKKSKPSIIPAVEVEPSGCSFNPSSESHQDVLACAVADEMQKIYKDELGPEPVPVTVVGKAIDEEEMYFLDADDGSDVEETPDNENDEGNVPPEKKSLKLKRITRVELNKRARRKALLKKEAEMKKVEQLSKEIDSISDIMQEIAKDDEEKQKRHLRRIVAKQERLKQCPPRLGKHKYEPAPMQVLLSEEITGSLRQLKGCCTLAKDRFKSLEKRGLIVPTAKRRRS
ncbi:ribosome biogenesis protein NOP53 isoform X1 [Punica granatum]|uniref:Ribosome biogenesis protein NOP53 n=1 Tax=Punica granatum TaxID=22663 RepID=A0A6P8BYU6_PUNGR|nr:ribosome biogenesis protein NOP53 isoform X1 [Punica granatum]